MLFFVFAAVILNISLRHTVLHSKSDLYHFFVACCVQVIVFIDLISLLLPMFTVISD